MTETALRQRLAWSRQQARRLPQTAEDRIREIDQLVLALTAERDRLLMRETT